MTIRRLLLPALIAAAFTAPAAFAQVDVGAQGATTLGAQAGPVGTHAQVGIDASAQSGVVRDTVESAKATGEQVGGQVKGVARAGAKAAENASNTAADAASGNANADADAKAKVAGKAHVNDAEPEEDDGD